MLETPETLSEAPLLVARYAVFGSPIAHSRSPVIHRAFAHATHLDLRYDAIESAIDSCRASSRSSPPTAGAGPTSPCR